MLGVMRWPVGAVGGSLRSIVSSYLALGGGGAVGLERSRAQL